MSSDSDPPAEPNRCLGCGGHVSPEFRRVFGDNDDEVYACPNCQNRNEFSRGATINPAHTARVKDGGR